MQKRESSKRKLGNWHVQSLLLKFDFFGSQLPVFNLKGASVVHTKMGGLLSFSIFVITMIYATIKLIQLFDRHNPNVTQFLERNVYDYREKLDLNEANFRIAFTVEGYLDRMMKNDPQYVKYLVRFYGRKNGKNFEE